MAEKINQTSGPSAAPPAAPTAAAPAATTTAPKASVMITRPQAYDLNMTVTLVPSRNIPSLIKPACQPRQGAERVDTDAVDLPDSTRSFLLGANKAVTAWLAASEENQHAFLTDPVAALSRAGVQMDRAQQKSIARLREALGQAQTIVPGMQLRSIQTKANKSGQVKAVDVSHSDWTPAKSPSASSDCNCHDPERK